MLPQLPAKFKELKNLFPATCDCCSLSYLPQLKVEWHEAVMPNIRTIYSGHVSLLLPLCLPLLMREWHEQQRPTSEKSVSGHMFNVALSATCQPFVWTLQLHKIKYCEVALGIKKMKVTLLSFSALVTARGWPTHGQDLKHCNLQYSFLNRF